MKRINLIPQEKRIDYSLRSLTRNFLVKDFPHSIVVIVTILLLLVTFQLLDTLRLRLLISSHKNKITLLQRESGEYERVYRKVQAEKEGLSRKKKILNDKTRAIERMKQQAFRWSIILEDIAKVMPKDVSLQSVSLKKDAITITGTTLDNMAVSNFMQSLDDSANFKDTKFSYTRKEEKRDEKGEHQAIINFGLTTLLQKQYGS